MSEFNSNAWPFSGAEGETGLDIASIFGGSPAGSDVNPFDVPAAGAANQETRQQSAAEQEQTAKEPAVSEPVQQVQTQEEPASEAPNLIAMAFDKQTEKNTQQGLLEKLPVFSYGGAKEEITDSGMTFEELRIAKADDFPELSEGKKVSWVVEYGKVTRQITDPKGTTIRSVKEQIEGSKQFLDGLKKAKDKCPDCLVKPKVTAQSKGIASYKGVFSTLAAAQASDKTICLIPGRDGRVYEYRKTESGEFVAPKDNVIEFQQIRAGFTPALPLIPQSLLNQIISFFRCYMNEAEEFEALAHIFWDRKAEKFVVHIPVQEVSRSRINADLSRDTLPEDRYLHYADIHSHNSMEAKFSLTDDRDEKATRLYIVLGRLDRFFPDISVRMSCGGAFQELDPASVLESVGKVFPSGWRHNVKTVRDHSPKEVPKEMAADFWG